MLFSKFKYFHCINDDLLNCGLTCLKMVADFHGKKYSLNSLKENCQVQISDFCLESISEAAEKIGFKSITMKLSYRQLEEIHLPAILQWNQEHFVVLYKIKKSFWSFLPWVSKEKQTHIADPNSGLLRLDKKTFLTNWLDKNSWRGSVLTITPQDPPDYF